LASRADIRGEIYGNTHILENPLGPTADGKTVSRIVITAFIVNKSPLVSPTIVNFICRMSLQDGEVVERSYIKDFSNDYNTTHRDDNGRQVGPFPC
jgi:hypothetical protein